MEGRQPFKGRKFLIMEKRHNCIVTKTVTIQDLILSVLNSGEGNYIKIKKRTYQKEDTGRTGTV